MIYQAKFRTALLNTAIKKPVQYALHNLMSDQASSFITHCLTQIRHADEIVVMQKGEIVERGKHDSLIVQNGFYKRLVDIRRCGKPMGFTGRHYSAANPIGLCQTNFIDFLILIHFF